MLQARRRQDRLPPGVGDHVLGLIDPGDHRPGAPGDNVERSERQLLPNREPRDPLDKKTKVGFGRTMSDVLGIPSWHGWAVIVWHVGSRQSGGCEASASRSDAASPQIIVIVMSEHG